MWYTIFSYLKFIFSSNNQHGVHSPFVFQFVTKCLYNKRPSQNYEAIKNYRQLLLQCNDVIAMQDLGPGSRVNKTNKRSIKEIAKNSGTTLKRAKLLFRCAEYFKPKNILELGTSLGIATHAMQLGNPNTLIKSIEGCPSCSSVAKKQLQNFENITLLTGDFSTQIKNLKTPKFDLVFFDGKHTKEATLNYFNMLLPKAHNDTVFIFDDIYWSREMTQAWEEIKSHKSITVTIDTFFWGFAFFRSEQEKEHFKIRI